MQIIRSFGAARRFFVSGCRCEILDFSRSPISAYLEYPESAKVLETVQAAHGKATEAWLLAIEVPVIMRKLLSDGGMCLA